MGKKERENFNPSIISGRRAGEGHSLSVLINFSGYILVWSDGPGLQISEFSISSSKPVSDDLVCDIKAS